ncbi:putative two-component signal transduction histidine kinase [Aurantimonas manganoxydans SI85-9A1]|uniref:histidine kinase n=2 Tax=Aurantimonas manganoxydans TaxID=651183 RepID=Q1YLB0_AURMS|nr:putative two-component signal transduction histidine kinase [Aurantimonas manganoxydans SI85-9A1]
MAGVADIAITIVVGLAAHWWTRTRPRTINVILVFGLAVAFGRLVAFLAIPADLRLSLLARTGVPLLVLTFISAVLIAVVLQWQARRRELSATNAIYRAMVRELPDCLNVKDVDGRFIAANPATAAMMRVRGAADLTGKTDFDFYPPELATRFRADETAMLESGKAIRIDQMTVFPDDSEGWLNTLKAPFRDHTGRIVGIITYNRDVTEQKRNAAVKNEFIATISHELRTPLTSIRGSLGLITAGVTGELPPKAAHMVEIAHNNSERLVLLINDILDLEKLESGKMPFDLQHTRLRPLLDQAISSSSSYMPERRVTIRLVDEAPDIEAKTDPNRLHQVFANILSNAIKFSPTGGTVTVTIARLGDDWVRMSVSDEGQGIPESFRKRIFGKFEQADATDNRQKGGTGLGLSIAKTIVEKLGGRIGFDTGDTGTTFHVDLPEQVARQNDPAGVIDHRPRVLVCEDERDIAEIVAAHLDAQGFASDIAPGIATARTLLSNFEYVAVTLDIRLAGDSGIELFHEIRRSPRNRDLPVLVISAVADETREALNGSAVGIIDWLAKPIDTDKLRAALDRVAICSAESRPRILHVEDNRDVTEVLAGGLGGDVCVTSARTLEAARELISRQPFDLVILDINLPDGSGLDLLPDLSSDVAVIIFSADEVDPNLPRRVNATLTKTRASELDVARLVRSYLPVGPKSGNA